MMTVKGYTWASRQETTPVIREMKKYAYSNEKTNPERFFV